MIQKEQEEVIQNSIIAVKKIQIIDVTHHPDITEAEMIHMTGLKVFTEEVKNTKKDIDENLT